MTSTPGRPLGRRESRSSIVGHPGASPEKGEPVFPSSPRSPLLHNGAQLCGAMDAAGPMDVANGCAAHRSLEIASRFPQHPQPKPKVFGDTINPSTKSGQLHFYSVLHPGALVCVQFVWPGFLLPPAFAAVLGAWGSRLASQRTRQVTLA